MNRHCHKVRIYCNFETFNCLRISPWVPAYSRVSECSIFFDMEEIRYYRASEEHIPLMTEMRIDFITEYAGSQGPKVAGKLKQELEKYFKTALKDNTYICWISEINGKVAGTGGIAIRVQPGNFKNPSGRVGYIMSMYTIPSYRRKGISTGILKRLSETAAGMGITLLELNATHEGEPVYVKNGLMLHKEPTYRKFI